MYNKDFQLNPNDLDIIENALRKEINRLNVSRQTAIESTIQPPENIASVREADGQIKIITELLGRLHNQKIWYHPKDKVYVSG